MKANSEISGVATGGCKIAKVGVLLLPEILVMDYLKRVLKISYLLVIPQIPVFVLLSDGKVQAPLMIFPFPGGVYIAGNILPFPSGRISY